MNASRVPDIEAFEERAAIAEYEGRLTRLQQSEGLLGPQRRPASLHGARLRKGCWITRTAFDTVGGLDEGIDVNEDMEFSVRIAVSGHRCYCDQTPGVILIRDPVCSASDQSSITKAAGLRAMFLGFEYILLKHQTF